MTTPTRRRSSPKRRRINPHALLAFRRTRNLTQEELASGAHVNNTTISRLEGGSRLTASIEVIERLAEELNVPPSALYVAED